MNNSNVTILVDAKQEYTKQLINILKDGIYKTIRDIYKVSVKESKKNDNDKYLVTFQSNLSKIPKWDKDKVENEFELVATNTKCDWIDDLLTAVFITHTKILTTVHQGEQNKKVNLKIPKGPHFLHLCFIESAREFWKNPYLFSDNVSRYEYQRNIRDCEGIIGDAINETIRKQLPVKHILKEYLGENYLSEVEEDVNITEQTTKKHLRDIKQMVEKDLTTSNNNNINIVDNNNLRSLIKEELSKSKLHDANVDDANVEDANVEDANVEDANVEDANVEDANLEDANVEDANVEDANVEDTNVEDTNVEDANVKDATVDDATVEDATVDDANVEDENVDDENVEVNEDNEEERKVVEVNEDANVEERKVVEVNEDNEDNEDNEEERKVVEVNEDNEDNEEERKVVEVNEDNEDTNDIDLDEVDSDNNSDDDSDDDSDSNSDENSDDNSGYSDSEYDNDDKLSITDIDDLDIDLTDELDDLDDLNEYDLDDNSINNQRNQLINDDEDVDGNSKTKEYKFFE